MTTTKTIIAPSLELGLFFVLCGGEGSFRGFGESCLKNF